MLRRSMFFGRVLAVVGLAITTGCQSKSGLLEARWMPRPRLQHVDRVWSFADSLQWRAKRDSILTAVTQLGGHAVVCDAMPSRRRFVDGALYWEYNGYYLKIRAQKSPAAYDWPQPWQVSLEGYSQMPFECLNRPD